MHTTTLVCFNSTFSKDSKLQHHLQKFNVTSFQFYTKIKDLQERSIKALYFNIKILKRHYQHYQLNKKMQNTILLTKLWKQESQQCVSKPNLKSCKAKQMDKRWTWTKTKKSKKNLKCFVITTWLETRACLSTKLEWEQKCSKHSRLPNKLFFWFQKCSKTIYISAFKVLCKPSLHSKALL